LNLLFDLAKSKLFHCHYSICDEKIQQDYAIFYLKFYKGTSKNRFEKGKWVECAECEETLNKTKSIRSNEQIHAYDFVTLRFIQLIL